MFQSPVLSLDDLLGRAYTERVAEALDALGAMSREEALAISSEKVEFFPESLQERNELLLAKVGETLIPPFADANRGAATDAFSRATNLAAAPLSGLCNMRLGEDGRLYLLGKSEHYHTPLGHGFRGYRLIDNARRLGILNATHNNTRGYVTRLCEREIVRQLNDCGTDAQLERVLESRKPQVLNRIINLETGSLACEAGIKMMLARFFRVDTSYGEPKNAGKIPVFFVMADEHGGREANYHGTTVFAQTMRGLWPEFAEKLENGGIYRVVPVKINDVSDFAEKIETYNSGEYRTAGFLHEIVLMNYGGIRLTEEYLHAAYDLCRKFDTPVMVDEIQSCMWYDGMLLYKLYGLKPDFVVLGKGFPGGEYPASKIVTTGEMDSLNLFGALVTNGQEELASLAYLVTMTFSRANGGEIARLGEFFENRLRSIGSAHPGVIRKVEGRGHLAALHFESVELAAKFAKILNGCCIDTSAQLYKPHCPPAVLLKPPVIASEATLGFIADKIEAALGEMKD